MKSSDYLMLLAAFIALVWIVFSWIGQANAGTRNPPLSPCQPIGWECVPPLKWND